MIRNRVDNATGLVAFPTTAACHEFLLLSARAEL
jgi:hypothetical protein